MEMKLKTIFLLITLLAFESLTLGNLIAQPYFSNSKNTVERNEALVAFQNDNNGTFLQVKPVLITYSKLALSKWPINVSTWNFLALQSHLQLTGIPYEACSVEDLLNMDLSQFSVIIFIDSTYLNSTLFNQLYSKLKNYLSTGGNLISIGYPPVLDENDNYNDILVGSDSGVFYAINGKTMKLVTLPDEFLPNDEGAPNLPGSGRYIALPHGAKAKLTIVSSRIEKFKNLNLAPAPRIPLDTEKGPLEYKKNEKIYSADAFYPADPIKLSAQTQIRGVDVVMLGITPFQYNPVTKELLVYRDVEVEISFEGGNNHFGEDRLRSRYWDTILKDAILNSATLPKVNYNYSSDNTRDQGYEYVIVVPDDAGFIAWADSLKMWRIKQGISTVVVTTTEIGGNTPTIIENYVNDIYANWDPAPSAVLLMGDYGTSGNTIVSPIYDNYCVSDNIYADVNGNDMPDVIFARMTAQNASQLETMVTKVINYENNPPTSPDFYDHPITALGWQTSRWFQICSETVGGFFKNVLGKTPVRINAINNGNPMVDPWSTATNTATVLSYFGPDGLGYIPASPSELGGWSGGNANDVNYAINNGAFLLQHRDHGGENGWGEPNYNNGDIDGLTNTDLTFVFSINCLTGKYNWSNECFTEKFHRYTYNGENSGALGLIAASEVSYSFVNDTYVWGMYDNMWPDFLPDYATDPEPRGLLPAFGNAGGKYFLQQSNWPYNTSNKEVTYNLFHHHGGAFSTMYSDGTLDVRNMQIKHDCFIKNVLAGEGI